MISYDEWRMTKKNKKKRHFRKRDIFEKETISKKRHFRKRDIFNLLYLLWSEIVNDEWRMTNYDEKSKKASFSFNFLWRMTNDEWRNLRLLLIKRDKRRHLRRHYCKRHYCRKHSRKETIWGRSWQKRHFRSHPWNLLKTLKRNVDRCPTIADTESEQDEVVI